MRDIDVVLAAVFAEDRDQGQRCPRHAFMLRPDLFTRMLPTSFFSPVLGSTLIMRLPSRSGKINSYSGPKPLAHGDGKAFGDNDPFKRFRRGHRLCLLRRCAPEARKGAQSNSVIAPAMAPGVVLASAHVSDVSIGTRRGLAAARLPVLSKTGSPAGSVRQSGENASPERGSFPALALPFKAEAPPSAGSREEGFGRGAGSCGNGRPHLSTAEQPQNFTHDG